MPDEERKIVCTNRKAFHDYTLLERFEAGLELRGSEVKSLREGKANLKDSYALIRKREVYLIGMHIGSYSHTGYSTHEPYRDRKLLLHRKEIEKLKRHVAERGHTIVPLHVHFLKGWAKVEIALAKGKRSYDKKDILAEKEQKRAMERELKYKSPKSSRKKTT